MTVLATIQEYFLLSDARATAKIVTADARAAIGRQLALGRQRSEAADALWSNGHVAEGLRLAAEALDATLAAVAPFEQAVGNPRGVLVPEEPRVPEPAPSEPASSTEGDEARASEESSDTDAEPPRDEAATATELSADAPEEPAVQSQEDSAPLATAISDDASRISDDASSVGPPAWAAVLQRRGLSEARTRAVLETDRAVRAKTLPLLDEQVSAADGELFQQLVTARRHVDGVLSPASMTAGQLSWTRASRIGFAAVLTSALLVGLYLLLRPPTGVEATGSGQYNAEFVPDNVIDDDDNSEWLLPDRQPGWVDVRIMPPEHIDTVRLKNSHNRHYNDRGTHEYTVEIYREGDAPGHPTKTIEGEWSQISPRPDWTEHAVDVDDVARIRFNVRSFHRSGGGLAEIDWD